MATAQVVALGAVAHASAGGALPSADALATLAVVTGAVSWALHERRLRLGPAALLVAAAQLALHLVAPAAPTAGAAHGNHLHAVAGATDTQMLLAHVVSAAATVLVLAWQEHVLVTLSRALSPRAHVVAAHAAPLRPALDHVLRRLPVLALDVAPRRGPPADYACARS